jgi:hypothetical protein
MFTCYRFQKLYLYSCRCHYLKIFSHFDALTPLPHISLVTVSTRTYGLSDNAAHECFDPLTLSQDQIVVARISPGSWSFSAAGLPPVCRLFHRDRTFEGRIVPRPERAGRTVTKTKITLLSPLHDCCLQQVSNSIQSSVEEHSWATVWAMLTELVAVAHLTMMLFQVSINPSP